jgi:hypothetical protein
MRPVLDVISRVGPSDANVLHHRRKRHRQGAGGADPALGLAALHAPLVTVNTGGLAEGVFESELFGHVKGAFTDAKTDRVGRFEMAEGGTLFLDEIANISQGLQSKLLRTSRPASSSAWAPPRRGAWTCASSRPPMPISARRWPRAVPPGSAVPAQHHRAPPAPAARPARGHPDSGRPLPAAARRTLPQAADGLRRSAIKALLAHAWPGNVRELDHAVERAVLMAQGEMVRAADLGLRAGREGPPRWRR